MGWRAPTHRPTKKNSHARDTAPRHIAQEERTLDGAIKDSHHVPAHVLKSDDAAVEAVLKAAADAGASTVVVHCALSQVRGPACASRLATRLKESGGLADLDVAVLRGGFSAWAASAPDGDEWTKRGG